MRYLAYDGCEQSFLVVVVLQLRIICIGPERMDHREVVEEVDRWYSFSALSAQSPAQRGLWNPPFSS
jgi:hypothetical protein